MKRILVALFFCLALIATASGSCFAWNMTNEFQKEIDQKLASVEANPDDPNARFDLAITYAYTNKVQEGWDELKKVNEMDPKFPPVALDMYTKRVAENPNDWKLRFRLAFAQYFNEKKKAAIDEMKRIADMEPKDDPKRIWAYGYISLIYGEMDNINEAIRYAKKAIKIDSNIAAMHMLLASGYSKKGQGWDAFWEGVEALRLKSLGY